MGNNKVKYKPKSFIRTFSGNYRGIFQMQQMISIFQKSGDLFLNDIKQAELKPKSIKASDKNTGGR